MAQHQCTSPTQPAALQTAISSLISSITLSTLLATCSKILAFLSFRTLECNKVSIVSKFGLISLGIPALAFNHQSSVVLKLRSGVWKSARAQSLNLAQTWILKLQWTNKCEQVSGSEEHRGQTLLDGQFLLSKLSAVRHLLWTASHIKKLAAWRRFGFPDWLITSKPSVP